MSTHGFELVREQRIPELNTYARLWRHTKTGAQLLSMENDDTNKVFGINFYTPPASSNGIAHIMEHSVLCGSRKYPVKEPFVELLKGSLNTFVNAFTFSDKTCYPVASQNLQDLYNLIDVYLDAVFYPRITPQTLQQEGWHYELDSTDGQMAYKGVVFNEMKGNYSSPDNMLGRYSEMVLFPDTHYGYDSGGDPKVIPDLTYEEFKAFHDQYYHPSNALIFFYGDDDPDQRLAIADNVLKDFDARPIDKSMSPQPRFDQPRHLTFPYDAGEEAEDGESAGKGLITVNWLLADTTDTQTSLGLKILDYLLIGTPASPLRKALIDSGLGESLAGAGLEDQVSQSYMSVGLKGIELPDAKNVEALILDTLRRLADNGISADAIEAALNTIEFQLRENNTGRFPRGIALMINSLSSWLYGGDPVAPLAFEAPLNAIRTQAASGYFEGLIRTYLLDNPHRATVLLAPDPELRPHNEQVEADRLAQARARLSPDEVQLIIQETEALKRAQETADSPEALATIPTLTRADLDLENKLIPISLSNPTSAPGSVILYHDLFTNGIVYLDLGFDLHLLPQAQLPYVGLFSRALLEMGTHHEDAITLTQRIGRKTGGLDTTSFNAMSAKSGQSVNHLFLRGKGTVAQTEDLLAIMADVLTDVNFDDREHFKQIVLEEKADAEAKIVPAGHQVALVRLRSHLNEADWAVEQMSGIEWLFFLRQLVDRIDSDWSSVLATLEAMRKTLLNRNAILLNVTLDNANWAKIEAAVTGFLANLPAAEVQRAIWSPDLTPVSEGLTIPAQVNYVAKGANAYQFGYQSHGSQLVILNYLRTTWLWERVRVQGGAYGGFVMFSKQSGALAYVSYRDPNLGNTIDIYDATGGYLRDLSLSDSELTRGIIGAIGQIDAYLLPDAKGYTSLINYLIGETDEERQQFRTEVLNTTEADFKAFGEVLNQVAAHGSVTVVGSAEDITAANSARGDFLKTIKVL